MERTPGEVVVTSSREPLKVVCESTGGLSSSAAASPSLSGQHGGGALTGGLVGGTAVAVGLGSVALAFIPVLGWGLVAVGAAVGAAGGSAVEASQQTLSYPPVISIAMSCEAAAGAADSPRAGGFGVGFRGLSLAEAQGLGISERGAVLVTAVAAGGAAERAGLRSGDIVRAVNGRELGSVAQLEQAVLALKPGESVALQAWRSGQPVELVLRLPESSP